MPSSMPTLDDQFPTLRGDESPKEMFSAIVNYLFVMKESLEYTLANLSAANWNTAAWNEMTDEAQQPAQQLAQVVSGLSSKVTQQGISVNDLYRDMCNTKDRATALESREEIADSNIVGLLEMALELTQRLEKVEQAVQTDADSGAITIGKENVPLQLVGQVSINGTPYEEGQV